MSKDEENFDEKRRELLSFSLSSGSFLIFMTVPLSPDCPGSRRPLHQGLEIQKHLRLQDTDMTIRTATTLHVHIPSYTFLTGSSWSWEKLRFISEIKWCQECELRKLGQIETDAALISVGKS
ncbi:hypothetical protein PO909_014017 [Leuciscus waleckii]